MTSATLLALPTELVQEIARHLDGKGQLALRLVCRQMTAKTYHTFRDVHFTTRRHIFTEFSLKGLVGLSQHEDLASAVRSLEISLLPFESKDRSSMNDPSSPFRVLDDTAREALTRFLDEQAFCHRSGMDVALLTRALLKLENLRTLRIRNEPAGSWGFQSLGEELGWPDYMVYGPFGRGLPGAYGFETVLAAMEASNAMINELEIDGGLPLTTLILPDRVLGRLQNATTNLRVLTLFVSLPLRPTEPGSDEELYTNNNSFLSILPNLEVLRLGTSRGRPSNLDNFIAEVFLKIPWLKLKGLHLYNLDCQRDILAPILRHCQELQYLLLEDGKVPGSCFKSALLEVEQHSNLVGILCKRFEVLPDAWNADGIPENANDPSKSPFVEFESPGPARHLLYDRNDSMPERRVPWCYFTEPRFWRKERIFIQMR